MDVEIILSASLCSPTSGCILNSLVVPPSGQFFKRVDMFLRMHCNCSSSVICNDERTRLTLFFIVSFAYRAKSIYVFNFQGSKKSSLMICHLSPTGDFETNNMELNEISIIWLKLWHKIFSMKISISSRGKCFYYSLFDISLFTR